jgi:hypothetical protein
MNAKLTKYLSDVFRNEVQHTNNLENKESNLQTSCYSMDRNHTQFVIDKRFSLRLDEII